VLQVPKQDNKTSKNHCRGKPRE